jgi:hypothetical protein
MTLSSSVRLTGLVLFITLTFGLSASAASAQDVERPERNESGSIAPERVKERAAKLPSDPSRFIESQANRVTEKLSRTRVRSASGSIAFRTEGLAPTDRALLVGAMATTPSLAVTPAPNATAFDSQLRDLYRIEARRLAASKRLLFSSEFLKAYMLAIHPRLRENLTANLRTLLNNKLLNDKSYETTLKQYLGFSPEEARAAVKNANAQLN